MTNLLKDRDKVIADSLIVVGKSFILTRLADEVGWGWKVDPELPCLSFTKIDEFSKAVKHLVELFGEKGLILTAKLANGSEFSLGNE